MRLKIISFTVLSVFLASASLSSVVSAAIPPAKKATKKSSKKQGSKTKKEETKSGMSAREKKILGWTSDYPTSYAVNKPEFFVRGTVLDFKKVSEDPKDKNYELQILPIEVVQNPQHYITMEHIKNGVSVKLEISKTEEKILKKGMTVEYNYYTKDLPPEDPTKKAQLISSENHTEFMPYDVPPVAYLSKQGLEPEQIANALRGILIYEGQIKKDEQLKTALTDLSKNSDSTLSENAKKLSAKLFGEK